MIVSLHIIRYRASHLAQGLYTCGSFELPNTTDGAYLAQERRLVKSHHLSTAKIIKIGVTTNLRLCFFSIIGTWLSTNRNERTKQATTFAPEGKKKNATTRHHRIGLCSKANLKLSLIVEAKKNDIGMVFAVREIEKAINKE